MMSGRYAVSRVFCMALLLCWNGRAFASMDKHNISAIIDYIKWYGPEYGQYAVAVRLDNQICRNPVRANLEMALPEAQMKELRDALGREGGIYNPPQIGDIVAARPIQMEGKHSEWHLLTGDSRTGSPVKRMLTNKDGNTGCLIFFSKLSPCVKSCLNKTNKKNILDSLKDTFSKFDSDSKAFVFEAIYKNDQNKRDETVNAWRQLDYVPLFRYSKRVFECFDDNKTSNSTPCFR